MKETIFLTVSALLYTIATAFIFIKKEKVNKVENRIFKRLLITSILSMLMELLIIVTVDMEIVSTLVQKLFLISLILWLSVFMTYTFVVTIFSSKRSEEDNIKKYKSIHYIFILINAIICFFILILPIKFNSIGAAKYTSGPAVNVVFSTLGIYVLIMSILVLIHIKDIHKKGYLPIILLIIFLILTGLIQKIHPEMLLSNAVFGFIVYIMFHTIENPDLNMIEQLEMAKNQAEKANRSKSDFLSSMSHEIRTPLNAIVGLSEDIASYEEQVPKEVVEDTQDIRNASQTLLEIVGNILDINKIEANKMEIVENIYNFREEITKMCKVTQTRIGEKNVIFHLNIADDMPYELIGDKGKVKEIVNNLLTNAIKYTEQGEINLNIKCINDTNKNISNIIISCQDTGKGIKADYINRLFTKFERLDVERNTTAEGTGLGLAITKALVEMMKGKINVQSQFGHGSIFMVQLPQKINKLMKPITEKELLNTVSKSYKNNNRNISYGHKKILIVDDNKLNIKVAFKALKDFNFEIDECYDGKECLDKINQGNVYDLILMDIMMPNMNGEEAMLKLRQIPSFKTPVIALTADALAGAKEKYMSEGFSDYIAKPFNREQIKEKLDIIFANKVDNKKDKWIDAPTYVIGNLQPLAEINNEEYLLDNDIDYKKGIELFGDLDTYKKMLSDWYKESKNKIKDIKDYMDIGDMHNYSIQVHALKSDSKYFGFNKLAELSLNHELKSKENDMNYVYSNFKELENEFNRVIVNVNIKM